MTFAIFFGGIFLGFIFGFVVMALLAIRGSRFQTEEAPASGSDFVCAYPRKFSPSLEDRPQAF